VRAPRFYVDSPLAVGADIDLPAASAHHAQHVLRLRPGMAVTLFNAKGGEFDGELINRERVRLLRHDPIERESPLAVTVVQAWIASDKLEWMVEKAVELGVARIALTPMQRSVVRLDAARRARRVQRLTDIAIAACEQCGRNRIPDIVAFDALDSALTEAASGGSGVLLQPQAVDALTQLAPTAGARISVAVGPEGGLDASEVQLAERCGYQPYRLGRRVLRTETAALAALAALQTIAGDFRR
jgi:16S rRNA (uracil1498-N3)-methyltransferase